MDRVRQKKMIENMIHALISSNIMQYWLLLIDMLLQGFFDLWECLWSNQTKEKWIQYATHRWKPLPIVLQVQLRMQNPHEYSAPIHFHSMQAEAYYHSNITIYIFFNLFLFANFNVLLSSKVLYIYNCCVVPFNFVKLKLSL